MITAGGPKTRNHLSAMALSRMVVSFPWEHSSDGVAGALVDQVVWLSKKSKSNCTTELNSVVMLPEAVDFGPGACQSVRTQHVSTTALTS